MTNMTLENTMFGKIAKRSGLKLNVYHIFLAILNFAALALAFWDAKGIAVLFVTVAYSLSLHLKYSQREEQRLTNELLEDILNKDTPLR
ncbi:hypothetical protein [Deinococcus hopiensis]|uniref:Uncharacterized protein n=1 Tax=Deinococcus hopiensis KR-140 TaxID=695939 RepID=A0A1W1UAY8_9DEIO|nr:hypothetical protein [Deinococcus hopiensis]SMB77934.1 hypothetical protein SAMN00790413_04013 [Deinococcus hopiensis KR-140]